MKFREYLRKWLTRKSEPEPVNRNRRSFLGLLATASVALAIPSIGLEALLSISGPYLEPLIHQSYWVEILDCITQQAIRDIQEIEDQKVLDAISLGLSF